MERSRASFNWEDPPFSGLIAEIPDASAFESIDDLAQRVLFAGTLDEKLRLSRRLPPGHDPELGHKSGDKCRFQGIIPGRPANLRFAANSETRPALPGRPGLVDDENRGILLHFFANHELLAAELMALALLKFPEAPHAFREGLANTLREEQIHTRWYVNRMRECGVEFGQYPLSRFFWEAVSKMESPLDYVSRLSLTFEQANLDYSLHYGTLLREAGDAKSAAILLRIYQDEIAHVGYGLRWFRQWKEQSESDWDALKKHLPFPLSPSRAKGNRTGFNEEGRRAAGFDEDYIQRLSIFERSKGRTPNVFYFNPDAEHRAAVWPQPYHADKKALAVIHDLELVAAFLARKDDVLLMRRPPSNAHLAKLRRCGLTLPEIEALDGNGQLDPAALVLHRKINRIQPWAIAPDLNELFAPLSMPPDRAGGTPWTKAHRDRFSKVEQVRALGRWMETSHPCDSPEALADAVGDLKYRGHGEAIVKRAFSTAGSGMHRVNLFDVESFLGRPLSNRILAEGGILLEPAHARVFDFSVQYRIEAGQAHLVGLVEQIISPGGGYRGSFCQVKFCKGMAPDLARFVMEEVLPLYEDESPLALDLAAWFGAVNYEGPLGVDAYVHRDADGQLILRPICEVNPRFTMGRVALELRRQIAPGSSLRFEIIKAHDVCAADDSPLLDEKGRMNGGSLLLTECHPHGHFVAKATVAKNWHCHEA